MVELSRWQSGGAMHWRVLLHHWISCLLRMDHSAWIYRKGNVAPPSWCHPPTPTPFREFMTVTQFISPSFIINPRTAAAIIIFSSPVCNKQSSVGPWVVALEVKRPYHSLFEYRHINRGIPPALHLMYSKVGYYPWSSSTSTLTRSSPKEIPEQLWHTSCLNHGQRLSDWWPWWLWS